MTPERCRTREPQYSPCFDGVQVALGPMTGWTFRQNPRRLGMMLARYKFVSKMLTGLGPVAEIGCADAFGSQVVAKEVSRLDIYDFDPIWYEHVPGHLQGGFRVHDILTGPLPGQYTAIYMLDVLEHIKPENEPKAMENIIASFGAPTGVFIAGCPSLESQAYAAEVSKAGHVNCRSGDKFRDDMFKYFRNVFLFTMHDEMIGVNFPQMAHYLFVLCCSPRW